MVCRPNLSAEINSCGKAACVCAPARFTAIKHMGLFLFSSVSGKIIHNNVKASVRICKIAADCKYIFEWGGGGGVLKNQCVMVNQLGLGRAGLHA